MRAQTEILGIAVVILLVSVGLLFVLGYAVNKEKPTHREEFVKVEIGYNMIFAVLETTTPCWGGLSVRDLVKDCAEKNFPEDRIQCFSQDSCAYAEAFIKENIFQKTLDTWGYQDSYSFIIDFPPYSAQDIVIGTTKQGERIPINYQIPTNAGDVTVKLYFYS